MQQDRNYRYAPVYSSGISPSQQRARQGYREPVICCEEGQGGSGVTGGCGGERENMVLAMAYVLSQPFEKLYSPEEAWNRGTIFKGLDLPYGGRR